MRWPRKSTCKEGTPEIVEYEQVCLDILNWLPERGEITSLVLNEPMQPFL